MVDKQTAIDNTDAVVQVRHRTGRVSPQKRRSLFGRTADLLRPTYDVPPSWQWYTGISRIIMLLVIATGMQQAAHQVISIAVLTAILLTATGCGIWYLLQVRSQKLVSSTLTWTQLFLDFSVVAATISFTGGASSFFTFLFVIVILEAGALMGLVQGFVFTMLSAIFLLFQGSPARIVPMSALPYWYNFMIQCLALFTTAVVSGYWNQRISRLKQFQREILDNMSSGFLICDPHGMILVANTAACDILRRTKEMLIGSDVEKVLVCESGAECPVVTVLRNGGDYASYEFQAHIAEGEQKQLGLTTNRLYDHHNRMIALIVSFTNLTEVAQMRRALQFQDRMAAVGESAAELTHEIRNPLASLRSAIEEMRKCMNSPELLLRLYAIALRESDHLNNIVSGFLEFARNPQFNRKPIEIDKLLGAIKCATEQMYPDIIVSIHVASPAAKMLGDSTQIRQMFDNIIRNSVEAMNHRGEILVTVRCFDNFAEIRFDDSGPGIAPDKVARVFEPFYTEKAHGIGMGLAVCLRIVTAHDGDIRVAARPGGGASIIVRLPVFKPKMESKG